MYMLVVSVLAQREARPLVYFFSASASASAFSLSLRKT